MRVHIVTIFPEAFPGPLGVGIVKRARERGLLDVEVWDLRQFTEDRHRTVDDTPYGGGAGMVMKPEPFVRAVERIRETAPEGAERVLLTTPQGRVVTLVGACEVSIGDYVLSGGEVAAMVIVEAVARLLPGAVGDQASVSQDSFTTGLLDYPHYTRPPEYRGLRVPEVLLSGHHEEIRRWRKREALRRTLLRRPDVLDRAVLDEEDRRILEELRAGKDRRE